MTLTGCMKTQDCSSGQGMSRYAMQFPAVAVALVCLCDR